MKIVEFNFDLSQVDRELFLQSCHFDEINTLWYISYENSIFTGKTKIVFQVIETYFMKLKYIFDQKSNPRIKIIGTYDPREDMILARYVHIDILESLKVMPSEIKFSDFDTKDRSKPYIRYYEVSDGNSGTKCMAKIYITEQIFRDAMMYDAYNGKMYAIEFDNIIKLGIYLPIDLCKNLTYIASMYKNWIVSISGECKIDSDNHIFVGETSLKLEISEEYFSNINNYNIN